MIHHVSHRGKGALKSNLMESKQEICTFFSHRESHRVLLQMNSEESKDIQGTDIFHLTQRL